MSKLYSFIQEGSLRYQSLRYQELTVVFTNNVDPDEAAHYELPQPNLHNLLSYLNFNMLQPG